MELSNEDSYKYASSFNSNFIAPVNDRERRHAHTKMERAHEVTRQTHTLSMVLAFAQDIDVVRSYVRVGMSFFCLLTCARSYDMNRKNCRNTVIAARANLDDAVLEMWVFGHRYLVDLYASFLSTRSRARVVVDREVSYGSILYPVHHKLIGNFGYDLEFSSFD